MPTRAVRRLGPLAVQSQRVDEAVEAIVGGLSRREPMAIAFANTHLLYYALRDPHFARELAQFQLLNDGIGVEVLARALCGAGFHDNLNGTDFTPRLLARAPAGSRVYLFGAKAHVVETAAAKIEAAYAHLVVCGYRHGYDTTLDEMLLRLQAAAPDVVLVATGNPSQEQWITEFRDRLPPCAYLGVGALFDFLADDRPRAPALVQRAHLEWLYRLAHEPGRLWRRYTLEIAYVTAALLGERLGLTRALAHR